MKKLSIAVMSLTLLASLSSAQVEAKTKVRIISAGKTAAVIELPEGILKVRAEKSLYNKADGTTTLTGQVSISVFQEKQQVMRIITDEALIEVEQATDVGIKLSEMRPLDLDTPVIIPPANSIGEVTLEKGFAGNPRTLTPEEFKQLMRTAKPMTKEEYFWNAIPADFWYKGTFSTPDGIYHFTLGLGGVNYLTPPKGSIGIFKFNGDASVQKK